MPEQVIYTILGENYVMVEELITTRTLTKYKTKIKSNQCIEQGIKEFNRGGWFGDPLVIVKVLVPEKNILKYNNE